MTTDRRGFMWTTWNNRQSQNRWMSLNMNKILLSRAMIFASVLIVGAGTGPAWSQSTEAPKAQVLQGKWTKVCDPESETRICMTTLDSYIKLPNANKPVWLASAAVRETGNGKSRSIRFRVPLHVRLKKGVLLRIDNGKVSSHGYDFCQAYGCEIVVNGTERFMQRLKMGGQVVLQFSDVRGNTHQVELTLAGFTKAVEGPPSKILKAEAQSVTTGAAAAPSSGKGDAPSQ